MALSQQTGLGALNLVPEDESAGTRVSTQTRRELEAKNTLRLVREDLEDLEADLAEPEGDKPSYLRGDFGANLLDERDVDRPVDEYARRRIASELLRAIDADLQSRKNWEEMASRAIQFMGMIYEEASGEVSSEGSISKAWSTVMLESCVGFWANAYAEFLPPDGPVKIRDDKPALAGLGVDGNPPDPEAAAEDQSDAQRIAKAEAFERVYNHFFLVGDKQYYRDFSRMLMSLGPKGTEFRKIYVNPLRRLPVSEWVKSENLIISNEAADLSTAERVTERIRMSQAKARRLQWMGHWLDVPLTRPHAEPTTQEKKIAELEGIKPEIELPADHQHTFYECCTERDLEGFEHTEGGRRSYLPLPYRFTIDRDSRQLVECRRDWKEDDELFQKRQHYVMFGLVPGFGLYYLGYCHLLGNTERAATAITREMIDAGMMAIFPGWIAAKGSLPKGTTQIRVGPMGVMEVNTAMGKRVSDSVEPIPMKPLDPNVLALLEKLESNARQVAGKLELPQGEGTQNIPVGTMIAIIDQSTKMSMAVHKGMHASRAEELELHRELVAEDPSVLTRYAKGSLRDKEWLAEEFEDMNLVPSSDPNTPSHVHRLMRGIGIMQIAQSFPTDPVAQRNVQEDLYRILQVPDPSRYLPDPNAPQPPPPPSPQEIAAQAKMGVAQLQAQMKQRDLDIQQQTAAADRASKERIAQTDLQAEQVKASGQIQTGILRAHTDTLNQARDHAHAAHQASLDRLHEAQQSGLDRMHDQMTQQADQQHEVATASLGQPTPNRPL